MSYDLDLIDRHGKILEFSEPHHLCGGTYAVGGTSEASLNVTYNYAKHFHYVFGPEGIRSLYGMTSLQSLPVMAKAVILLGDDVDPDYWKPTEGNARLAILDLMTLAQLAIREGHPDAVWKGD